MTDETLVKITVDGEHVYELIDTSMQLGMDTGHNPVGYAVTTLSIALSLVAAEGGVSKQNLLDQLDRNFDDLKKIHDDAATEVAAEEAVESTKH